MNFKRIKYTFARLENYFMKSASLKLISYYIYSFALMQTKKKFPIYISTNEIQYAKGFEIYTYEGYSIVKITNPWPEAKKLSVMF
jgi:iron complex transport system substrate-binding protein